MSAGTDGRSYALAYLVVFRSVVGGCVRSVASGCVVLSSVFCVGPLLGTASMFWTGLSLGMICGVAAFDGLEHVNGVSGVSVLS